MALRLVVHLIEVPEARPDVAHEVVVVVVGVVLVWGGVIVGEEAEVVVVVWWGVVGVEGGGGGVQWAGVGLVKKHLFENLWNFDITRKLLYHLSSMLFHHINCMDHSKLRSTDITLN